MKNSRNIILFSFFTFFNSLNFYVPLKIIYFQHISNSYTFATAIISFTWVISSFLEIPTGIFSDIVGRKKTMLMGAFCLIWAYVLFAISKNYLILFFGAFLEGASRAFYSGNNNAFLYNSLAKQGKEGEFDHYYGKISAFLTIASITAALLSGVFFAKSYLLLMWASVIPQVISFTLILFMENISLEKKDNINVLLHLRDSYREIKYNLNLKYLSLAEIFGGAGEAAYEFHAAVFNAVWPIWAVGIARAIQEVGVMPGYYFASRIIKKYGEGKVIMLQTWISWIGNIVVVVLRSVFTPIMILTSLVFYGPSDTAALSLIQKEFTEKQRATIASINSFGSSIYFAIVLNIAGLVANKFDSFFGLFTTQIFFIPVIYYRYKLLKNLK